MGKLDFLNEGDHGFNHTGRQCKVEIKQCLSFQKFRYYGEPGRPGKKFQEKNFLQLSLHDMSGRIVQVQITCFDAERPCEFHPNGLVGRDCEFGVYTKTYPISKSIQIIRIPYLRIARIKTRETKNARGTKTNCSTPADTLRERATKVLPSPYKERCLQQCEEDRRDYDTNRVCLGIIITMEDNPCDPLFDLSNVIQNASEKTQLKVHKLSAYSVSAMDGGKLDIFTTDDGPDITPDKCTVHVEVTSADREMLLWKSENFSPQKEDILYKRVVTYHIPPYKPDPMTEVRVQGTLRISCMQSGQTSTCDFEYEPSSDCIEKETSCPTTQGIKRAHSPNLMDSQSHNVKLRIKEIVKNGRVRESGETYDLHKPESFLPAKASSSSTTTTVTAEVFSLNAIQQALGSTGKIMYMSDVQQHLVDPAPLSTECKASTSNSAFTHPVGLSLSQIRTVPALQTNLVNAARHVETRNLSAWSVDKAESSNVTTTPTTDAASNPTSRETSMLPILTPSTLRSTPDQYNAISSSLPISCDNLFFTNLLSNGTYGELMDTISSPSLDPDIPEIFYGDLSNSAVREMVLPYLNNSC